MLLFLLLAVILGIFELRAQQRAGGPARAYVVYAVLMAAAVALAAAFYMSASFTLTGWLPHLDPPYGGVS